MEVKLTPEEDALLRDMRDSRYDELKSGRVKPIDGEEAFSLLKTKTEAQCTRSEANGRNSAWATVVIEPTKKFETERTRRSRAGALTDPIDKDRSLNELADLPMG